MLWPHIGHILSRIEVVGAERYELVMCLPCMLAWKVFLFMESATVSERIRGPDTDTVVNLKPQSLQLPVSWCLAGFCADDGNAAHA